MMPWKSEVLLKQKKKAAHIPDPWKLNWTLRRNEPLEWISTTFVTIACFRVGQSTATRLPTLFFWFPLYSFKHRYAMNIQFGNAANLVSLVCQIFIPRILLWQRLQKLCSNLKTKKHSEKRNQSCTEKFLTTKEKIPSPTQFLHTACHCLQTMWRMIWKQTLGTWGNINSQAFWLQQWTTISIPSVFPVLLTNCAYHSENGLIYFVVDIIIY